MAGFNSSLLSSTILCVGTVLLTINSVGAQLRMGPVQVAETPLFTTSPAPCSLIVNNSMFNGTCCALNSTAGDGCLLSVSNGNCRILGQWWTVDYTSTSSQPCPQGEFTNAELGIDEPAEEDTNTTDALDDSSSSSSNSTTTTTTPTPTPTDEPVEEDTNTTDVLDDSGSGSNSTTTTTTDEPIEEDTNTTDVLDDSGSSSNSAPRPTDLEGSGSSGATNSHRIQIGVLTTVVVQYWILKLFHW